MVPQRDVLGKLALSAGNNSASCATETQKSMIFASSQSAVTGVTICSGKGCEGPQIDMFPLQNSVVALGGAEEEETKDMWASPMLPPRRVTTKGMRSVQRSVLASRASRIHALRSGATPARKMSFIDIEDEGGDNIAIDFGETFGEEDGYLDVYPEE